jgi:hypothetical protein
MVLMDGDQTYSIILFCYSNTSHQQRQELFRTMA